MQPPRGPHGRKSTGRSAANHFHHMTGGQLGSWSIDGRQLTVMATRVLQLSFLLAKTTRRNLQLKMAAHRAGGGDSDDDKGSELVFQMNRHRFALPPLSWAVLGLIQIPVMILVEGKDVKIINQEEFSESLTLPPSTTELVTPHSCCLLRNGNIAVSDRGRHRVRIINTGGHTVSVLGDGMGSGPREFMDPNGIAELADGSIAVADSCNNRIKVYHPQGDLLHIVDVLGNVVDPTLSPQERGMGTPAETGDSTYSPQRERDDDPHVLNNPIGLTAPRCLTKDVMMVLDANDVFLKVLGGTTRGHHTPVVLHDGTEMHSGITPVKVKKDHEDDNNDGNNEYEIDGWSLSPSGWRGDLVTFIDRSSRKVYHFDLGRRSFQVALELGDGETHAACVELGCGAFAVVSSNMLTKESRLQKIVDRRELMLPNDVRSSLAIGKRPKSLAAGFIY